MSGMRPFPMQDGPPIPWFIAEAIWTHLYRDSQPLDVVAQRGGFGWDEVAYMWSFKWRTTKEQRQACREQIVEVMATEADLAALREAAQAVVDAEASITFWRPSDRQALDVLRAVLASADGESREETP